ncbi:MAG: site-2 protease family protein, partial [Myxococcota bacterium]
FGRYFHYALLPLFGLNYLYWQSLEPGAVWLVWFGLLFGMRWLSGPDHPPTDADATLSPLRKAIAVATLIMFALIFMPTPLRIG